MEQTAQETSGGQPCPDCHALVSDLEAHKAWHRRLVATLATAVEDEIKRTTTGRG